MFSKLTSYFWSTKKVEPDDSGLRYTRNEENIILGRGGYGFVFRGSYEDKQVAIKRTQLCQLENNNIHEIEGYAKLEHQNVIKILRCKDDNVFRCFHVYFQKMCHAQLNYTFSDT